jgi:hypothetical protein
MNLKRFYTRRVFGFIVVLAIVFFAFAMYQIYNLNIAHSTFDDYYKFRGCSELIEKTDTYGTCRLANGETIKIVKFEGRWFLDGDLPGGFLSW